MREQEEEEEEEEGQRTSERARVTIIGDESNRYNTTGTINDARVT